MADADEVLRDAATRFKSLDNTLQSLMVLLESIATDVHHHTQQLASMTENQSPTRDEFAELWAMVKQQYETSKHQVATTERLVRIVEALIQQQVERASSERFETRSQFLESRAERKVRNDPND